MKETPNEGDKITLSGGHMVCDLLFEGFIGSRQEKCREKNFFLIYIPFNYFDSTKKRGKKVDGVHAEKIKSLVVIHPVEHKDLPAVT